MAECEELSIFREPQCLITTDDMGHLQVVGPVHQELRSLENRKLVVVAIAGLYRTGKSYLMNRLAGKSVGFALGSTIQSKTKGIWIWIRPHPLDPGAYLVLMDTEGLGDAEKGNAKHDESIITLATLLSSTLVYNYLGAISDDVITKLNFVAIIIKILKGNNGLDVKMPLFIMALRDFCLELNIDGQEVTADEYLEHLFRSRDDRNDEFNALRNGIRENFPNRKCFTFDRPANERAKLKQLETLIDGDLSEDFLNDSHRFTNYVNNYCPVMTLPNGTTVTGSMYASLVTSYVDAIREGELPHIGNALSTLAEEETRKAIERADRKFREEMRRNLRIPADQFDLDCALANASMSASTTFERNLFMDGRGIRKLDERIEGLFKEYKKKNDTSSREKCRDMLRVLDLRIKKKSEKGQYSAIGGHAAFQRDIEEVKVAYNKCENLGVKMESVLKWYLKEADGKAKFIHLTEQGLKLEARRREAAEAEQRDAELRAEEERRRKERVKKDQEARQREMELYNESLRLQQELQLEEDRLMCEQETEELLTLQREFLTEDHMGEMDALELQRILWDERVTAYRTNNDEDIEFYEHDFL